jgi:hypothetical protein
MMTEQYAELTALMARVRNRWRLLLALRAWALAAAAAALVLALALLAHVLFLPEGAALIVLWGVAGVGALICLASAIAPLRRAPRDLQLARFIEERCPELDDALVTAVGEPGFADVGSRRDPTRRRWLGGPPTRTAPADRSRDPAHVSNPVAAAVLDDALRCLRKIDNDRIISRRALRRAALVAGASTSALFILAAFSAGPARQASRLAGVYLFPERLALDVTPGDVKIRAGDPLRVVAKISSAAAVVPVLKVGEGAEWRQTRMEPAADGFAVAFERVEKDFRYSVNAAGTASREYTVTVVHPPRVERIDLRYEYPPAFRMPAREDKDGGDIYGPAGTRVRVTVHADKPVTRAALNVTGGQPIALEKRGDALEGDLIIAEDGSYRVALADTDGLSNPGDTEYFIRTLEDRPPDVRIVRPASDRQVTRVEEVSIEARADDDFGVASLDLVYAIGGGPEKALPFEREGQGTAISGRRTVYLEDLPVRPGDFVAYYARARDVSRGKRSTEARSDIFFLEVTPFEEEFVASQSQGAGGGGDSGAIEGLIQEQKDIVTATWNLDRRAREAGGRADEDIRAVARAQRDLRGRAAATLTQMQRANDVRRRRQIAGRGGQADPDAMVEAVGRAVEAMGKAHEQLEALKTSVALPHEMTALNELLRAQAEVRRREVQQQQANGSGGGRGSNRQQQDISSLFDRELAKQQQTNYESPGRPETRQEEADDNSALEKIRELARRQDALNRSQQELAKNRETTTTEELRRELERLTREQGELRRQAEELARQLQQGAQAQGSQPPQSAEQQQQGSQGQRSQGRQGQAGKGQQSQGQQGQGQPGQQSQGQQGQGQPGGDRRRQASRDLQQISEDMQGAASELRRENPQEASARGNRAVERLRDLEQRMRGAQPDDRRRALGEMQLESRQLADAQRRLADEVGARGTGDQADRSRRRAAEQERLAERTERLEQGVRQLAGAAQGADPRERNALKDAVREIEERRPSQRMRDAARAAAPGAVAGGLPASGEDPARQAPGSKDAARADGENIARTLDRLADRLGAAGGQSEDSERLTEELSRIRELREELAGLDRQLSELRAQSGDPNGGARGRSGQPARGKSAAGEQPGDAPGGGVPGAGVQGGGVQNGDAQAPWQTARELLNELQRENRLENPSEAEGFNPGRSAPGTEAWKQDFAQWDELKVQIAAALERAEQTAADRARAEQSRDRLNAGATQAVPESYRRLVEKYYRALASGSSEGRK